MNKSNEEIFKEILEQSLAGYWDWDVPSGNEYLSPSFKQMFGYEDHEIENRADSWQKLIFAEDLPGVFEKFDLHLKSKGAVPFYNEVRYHHKNGSTVWVICKGKVIEWDDEGNAKRMVGCHIDITERKQVEKALGKQNSLFETLLKNLQIGVYMMEVPSGKPLLANEASFKLLGRGILPEVNATTITTVYDLYKSDTNKPYPNEELPLVVAMSGMSKQVDDIIVAKPDGTRTALEVFGSPIKDEKGNIWASLVSFQDITGRKQADKMLRDSEEKYRVLVTNLSSGVVVHAPDSSVIFSNPMASTLLGLTKDQMRGKEAMDPAWSFLREDGMALPLAEYPVNRVLSSGAPIANQVLGIRRQDLAEPVWVQCNAYPVTSADGALLQVVVTFSDITGLKVYEKELQQKNAELERFTYTVSHDLKSPIITIKGFTGSLEKDLAKGNYERMAGDLKRVSNAADRMNDLLRDLLELSTIGRVINTPETVDMNLLVKDVLAQLAGPLKNSNLNVAVQPDLPEVLCDRRRMAEVLQNLVENAIHYRGNQVEPKILCGVRKEEGVNIFFVQDNGIGIDEKYHHIIFGLFNKLDANSNGTGIGLALVKRIIEVHGGRVWVESEGEGKGSRFCFTVPDAGVRS